MSIVTEKVLERLNSNLPESIDLLLEEARFNHLTEFYQMKEYLENFSSILYSNQSVFEHRMKKNKKMNITINVLEKFVLTKEDLLTDVVNRYLSRKF
jgi:hypothetical protein